MNCHPDTQPCFRHGPPETSTFRRWSLMNFYPNQPDRFLGMQAVKALAALGKTRIYAEIKAGRFPKPVKLGRKSVWPESEVRAWIEARKAERSAA